MAKSFVAMFIAALLAVVIVEGRQPVQAQPQPAGRAWEYALFQVTTSSRSNDVSYSWSAPKLKTISSKSVAEFEQAFGSTFDVNKGLYSGILNCAGSEGWEFVQRDIDNFEGMATERFIFKRESR